MDTGDVPSYTDLTREDVLDAIQRMDKTGNHGAPSTGYDVLHHGRTYPPKECLYVACNVKYPGRGYPRLSGGKHANNLLKKLGFTIVDKRGNAV